MLSDLDRCILISLTLSLELSLKVLLFLLCFRELWIRCLERENVRFMEGSLVFSYSKTLLRMFT